MSHSPPGRMSRDPSLRYGIAVLGRPPDGLCAAMVAGLESNHQNNNLISIPLLGSVKNRPHTLPHIIVNLTAVRYFVWGGQLENERSAERPTNAFIEPAG